MGSSEHGFILFFRFLWFLCFLRAAHTVVRPGLPGEKGLPAARSSEPARVGSRGGPADGGPDVVGLGAWGKQMWLP